VWHFLDLPGRVTHRGAAKAEFVLSQSSRCEGCGVVMRRRQAEGSMSPAPARISANNDMAQRDDRGCKYADTQEHRR
jgi:hypothetical protein